jgi:hypothetical protein
MAKKVREPVSLTLEEQRDHWERVRAQAEGWINRAQQIATWAQEMKSEAMRGSLIS